MSRRTKGLLLDASRVSNTLPFGLRRCFSALPILTAICAFMMPSALGKIITYDSKLGPPRGEVVYDLKVPPEEWSSLPVWSNSGRYLAVVWPPTGRINTKGYITEVPLKRHEVWSGTARVGRPFAALKKLPVRIRLSGSRSVLLNADTFDRLPVAIPQVWRDAIWSPDDKMIAGSFVGPGIFSAVKNEMILQIPVKRQNFLCQDLSWSPDSKFLASAEIAGVSVWSIASGSKVYTLPDLAGKCDSLNWSPDGTLIAAIGGIDEEDVLSTELRVCDWKNNKIVFKALASGGFGAAAWSKSASNKSLFAYSDSALHLMNSDFSKELAQLPIAGGADAKFQWSPDGRYIAYKGNEPDLHIYSVESMREVLVIPAEPNGIFTFHWSPNSRYLALAGNSQLAICDAQTGKYLGSKKIIDVLPPRWSPDGKSIAVNNYADDSIRLLSLNFEPSSVVFAGGASGNPWKDQVRLQKVEDCFAEITRIYDPGYIKKFRECPKEELHNYTRGMCGIGFGSDLRNMWQLRYHSPLVEYFNKLGITDGENMSNIIITSYWRHLNNQPVDLEPQLEAARIDEKRELPIIAENRKLSDKFVQDFKLSSSTIQESKAPVTVLAFINEDDSLTMKGLIKLRSLFPKDQVAIKLVTLTSDLMAYGKERSGKREKVEAEVRESEYSEPPRKSPGLTGKAPTKDFAQEFDDLLEKHKDDIASQNGSLAQYELLKKETADQINPNSFGMPQILVIKNGNYLATRFNYFPIGEEHTKKVREAIKACLP